MTLLALFSSVLGTAIVAASGILKIPQILRLYNASSAEGVSLASHLLESINSGVSLAWGISLGLAFSSYGEAVIIFAQLMILNMMIGIYSNKLPIAIGACTIIIMMVYGLSVRIIPKSVHEVLFSCGIIFTITSRLPQIYLNYNKRSVGQLSFVTCFLSFGGTAARVLTTAVSVPWEGGKAILLSQYCIGLMLWSVIIIQFLLYGTVPLVSRFLGHVTVGKEKKSE
eukprot:Tbor_TRINITY_DN5139_c3_g2::TRINITY_DN5139_c3_g2_i1::g.25724::m.25724/K09660/MPDU1; mannose-P-dolichol utilization defect 1